VTILLRSFDRTPRTIPPPILTSLHLTTQEDRYIPLALARSHMEKMMVELNNMKERHGQTVAKLDAQYRQIEENTQNHYLEFIQELKVRCMLLAFLRMPAWCLSCASCGVLWPWLRRAFAASAARRGVSLLGDESCTPLRIRPTQGKAVVRIETYKKLLRDTEREMTTLKTDLSAKIESLEERLQVWT
jgi:hypothetical protein